VNQAILVGFDGQEIACRDNTDYTQNLFKKIIDIDLTSRILGKIMVYPPLKLKYIIIFFFSNQKNSISYPVRLSYDKCCIFVFCVINHFIFILISSLMFSFVLFVINRVLLCFLLQTAPDVGLSISRTHQHPDEEKEKEYGGGQQDGCNDCKIFLGEERFNRVAFFVSVCWYPIRRDPYEIIEWTLVNITSS